jgi:hypothetical protein
MFSVAYPILYEWYIAVVQLEQWPAVTRPAPAATHLLAHICVTVSDLLLSAYTRARTLPSID